MFPVKRKVVRGGSGLRVGDGDGDGSGVAVGAKGVGGAGEGVSAVFSKGREIEGEAGKVGVEAGVGAGNAGGLQAVEERSKKMRKKPGRPRINPRASRITGLKPAGKN